MEKKEDVGSQREKKTQKINQNELWKNTMCSNKLITN